MSFKKLIEALFGATSAKPQGLYQEIELVGDGLNRAFTMPIDGWASLNGQSPIADTYMNNFIWGNAGQERPTASVSAKAEPGYTSQSLGFFKKGQQVNYNMQGYSWNSVKIFSLLGGGYRLLLKIFQSGGATCLRLKNCSTLGRKESELRNRKGVYLTDSLKEVQRKTNAQSRLLRLLTDLPKFPHGFATTLLSQTIRSLAKQALSATESFGAEAQTLRIAEPLFPVERVTALRCNSRFLLTTPGRFRGKSRSSLVSALPNLCANCEEVHYVA